MADIDLIIAVHTDGIKQVTDLSASLRNLSANIAGINVPMSKLDSHTRALNKALGMGARGAKEHATSFKGLIQNQKVLSLETKNLTKDIKAMNAVMRAGYTTDLINPASVANLKTLQTTLKNMRLRAFSSDIQSIGLGLKKLGKDAQFVGRSLMINLTAPFTLMSRYGLKALTDIDKEAIRLTKVMDGVAMSIEQAMAKTGQDASSPLVQKLVKNYQELNDALTATSAKYGIAKSLTIGLAADFAELGLGAKESVASITELTAATEKLGGMDISQSQDLIQAMYFQSIRAFDQAGRAFVSAAAKEKAAIESSTAQLQMFNAIENTTALTMRDLGDAFPEVASMATTFGLSMTEAAAMLAPMKAAGLEVGASANAIKVSLQRLVAPTKANAEMLASLSESYRNTTQGSQAFNNATRSGLTGLLGIVESFTAVKDSSAGLEGAMQMMAKIFGVRQGPRMTIAIQQLAQFNDELRKADPMGRSVAKTLVNLANGASNSSKLAIKNFTDIGVIARVATAQVGQQVENFGVVTVKDIKDANAARKAVADEILRANREGRDIMSEINTEAGRSMIVELAGSASASVLAQKELDASLKSLDITVSKIKNNFKLFAADLLNSTRPAIEKIAEITGKLIDKWNSLSATTKNTVGVLVMSIMGALAAIGPLILAFGTLSSVTGIAMRGIFKFIPSLKNAEGGFIGLADAIGKSGNKLDALYNSFASSKFLQQSTAGIAAAAGLPMGPGATAAAAAAGTAPSSRPFKFARVKGAITQVGGIGIPAPGGVGPVMPGSTRGLTAARRAYALEEMALTDRAGITTTRTGRFQQSPTLGVRDRFRQLRTGSAPGRSFIPTSVVNDAMERRLSAFDTAGITRGAGSGQLFNARGRALSEDRALRIARGGVGGRISSALQRGKEARDVMAGATPGSVGRGVLAGQRRLITQPLTSAKGLATAGIGKVKDLDVYKNALTRVAEAQKQLRIDQAAFGKGAVSTFSQAKTSLMAFMNTQKLATTVAKLFRVAMVSSGIGIVLLAIGVAIYAVMKNFDKFKAVASSGIEKVKVAFDILKSAAMEIIRPFVDLFAVFGKGGKDGAGAAEGIGAAFNKIAGVIQFLAKMVYRFVTQFIQPYLYMIINIVMAVVEAFKGNWGKAFDYVKAAFGFFIELLINGIALGIKIILKSVGLLAKGMISLFGMAIKVWIEIAFAGVTLIMKAISFIPGIGDKINNAYRGVINGIKGTVDSVTGAVNGGIDATVNGMSGLVDAGAKAVKGSLKSLQGSGIKKSTGKMFDGGKEVAKTKGDEVGGIYNEAITNSVGEGLGESLKDAAGKAFKDSVKDLAQQLQDYVMGEMSNALSKLQKDLEASLKKQKDAALAVYDSQVDTLDKLAKAEESLTKTKEYEAARRQAIEERALQSQNYIRNRALAIYEGRIDDARMLDLQDRKDAIDSTKSIGQIDSSRKKDLAAENLDALKTAIATAREEADKFFETTATKFGESAAEILKFPPVTKQDYIDQMTSLTELVKTTANDSGIEFSKMFDAFASSINSKMPNDVVGAFTTNLDDLVKVAVEKYGLGKGSADNKTIIGSTIGMLMDMGGVMDGNRQFVVDSFGTITTGLKDNMSTGLTEITTTIYSKFVTDFDKAVTDADPTTVYQKAIKDGNKAILDDFRKTVGGVGSEVDNMKDLLDPLIQKWAALEAQAKAAGDAQAEAASGGGGGTPSTGTVTGGTYGGINMNSRSAAYWSSVNKALGIAPRLTPITGGPKWMGGMIPSFARGGYLDKAMSQSIPAMLHGGEYIVSAKAVQNIGAATLQNLNNMRFNAPKNSAPNAGQSVTMSTQNTNIYVDNFIGEEEWFNSMMKEYNVNVLPKNQKAAGVQPRVVRSYNGINQGL